MSDLAKVLAKASPKARKRIIAAWKKRQERPQSPSAKIIVGDCVEWMGAMGEGSIDAIVTDPPYGLKFMGKNWDSMGHGNEQQAWHALWVVEAYRVLKPGGHVLAFGGTRTFHRLASALEDAGFEIRDTIEWAYGTGFPKSLNVGKAIDKAAGKEREVIGKSARHVSGKPEQRTAGLLGSTTFQETVGMGQYLTAPATPEAAQWEGFGTSLKPAHEPIILARKPLVGTVASNILEHGTGALNIDGTRIGPGHKNGTGRDGEPSAERRYVEQGATNIAATPGPRGGAPEGRWPANLILTHSPECEYLGVKRVKGSNTKPSDVGKGRDGNHTKGIYGAKESKVTVSHTDEDGMEEVSSYECTEDCPVRILDEQSGVRPGGVWPAKRGADKDRVAYGKYGGQKGLEARKDIAGGASRFFYVTKASRKERNAGLDATKNNHPTIKPIDLMRYLCRLITPPNGTILDPFAGSGSTLIAAMLEGFDSIGIELEPEYAAIAEARIAHWEKV